MEETPGNVSAINKFKYLIALFVLAIVMYLVNNVFLENLKASGSSNIISIPIVVALMLGIGFLINVIFGRPIELSRSAKFGFYSYLVFVTVMLIVTIISIYGRR